MGDHHPLCKEKERSFENCPSYLCRELRGGTPPEWEPYSKRKSVQCDKCEVWFRDEEALGQHYIYPEDDSVDPEDSEGPNDPLVIFCLTPVEMRLQGWKRAGKLGSWYMGSKTCPNGHLWTEKSSYFNRDFGRGRECRTCRDSRPSSYVPHPRPLATHCGKGHEWNEENTHIVASTGRRICRACRREWNRLNPKVYKYEKQPPRTHCKNGHEYTEENTYVTPTTGVRVCRTCRLDRERKRNEARPPRPPKPWKPRKPRTPPKRRDDFFTHCANGHEWNGDSLYIVPKTGQRQCRVCGRLRRTPKGKKMKKKEKTHCVNGHEYTEENAYFWRGVRRCRICMAAQAARRKAAQDEEESDA